MNNVSSCVVSSVSYTFCTFNKAPSFEPASSQKRSRILLRSCLSLSVLSAADPFFARIAMSLVGSRTTLTIFCLWICDVMSSKLSLLILLLVRKGGLKSYTISITLSSSVSSRSTFCMSRNSPDPSMRLCSHLFSSAFFSYCFRLTFY